MKIDDCHDWTIVLPRYLLNDACVLAGKPLVSGSALRWEGQLTVYNHRGGPTYRCLYPTPPPPGRSWMRSGLVVRASGCQCRSRTSPGFDPSILCDTVESKRRQLKQCWIQYMEKKNPKIPLLFFLQGSGSGSRFCYLLKVKCWFLFFLLFSLFSLVFNKAGDGL